WRNTTPGTGTGAQAGRKPPPVVSLRKARLPIKVFGQQRMRRWPVSLILVLDVDGVYRPLHPERTVLYRVLYHYFDQFISEYESRFEKKHRFFLPITKEVVDRYLDCRNPRSGIVRIRRPDCGVERSQPGEDQDKDRGRASGKIHNSSSLIPRTPLPG
ncbi:MAG: hypothetical protein ACUVV5_12825, partial [Candidatus Aminicenantales bacterium]